MIDRILMALFLALAFAAALGAGVVLAVLLVTAATGGHQ